MNEICFFCKGPAKWCRNNRQQYLENIELGKELIFQRELIKEGEREDFDYSKSLHLLKINDNLCVDEQPKFRKTTINEGYYIGIDGGPILYPTLLKTFFDSTPSETYEVLKIKNPSDKFFFRYLKVIRPSIRQISISERMVDHDLETLAYNKIVERKLKLRQVIK